MEIQPAAVEPVPDEEQEEEEEEADADSGFLSEAETMVNVFDNGIDPYYVPEEGKYISNIYSSTSILILILNLYIFWKHDRR